MREAAMKRKLLQQASLMSEWTGESVRVRMTAEGQPDVLDMVKHPSATPALKSLTSTNTSSLQEAAQETSTHEVINDPCCFRL